MISLMLTVVLSQATNCKAFSYSRETALTTDVRLIRSVPSGAPILQSRTYSIFETLECGSIDTAHGALVAFAIDYPIFNAVDCARVPPPRVELFDGNGSPLAAPTVQTLWSGVCYATGFVSTYSSVRMVVRSEVPLSRLRLGAFER